MKIFNTLIKTVAIAAVLVFTGCEKVEAPKESVKLVIESALLKGIEGEDEIIAGKPVKFVASVKVEGSELEAYTLEIKKDETIIGSAAGELTGTSATIEKELTLDVNTATLDTPFYPTVTLKIINKDEMYTEKILTEVENVKITTIDLLLGEQLCGEWKLETPAETNVYLAFFSNKTFEEYQRLDEGGYELRRGTWQLDQSLLSGKYNDGTDWSSTYSIMIADKVMTMISGNDDAIEYSYMKTDIPDAIKENCEVVVKSAGLF